jgi:hypothetical protein
VELGEETLLGTTTIQVEPSPRQAEWQAATTGGDDALLSALLASEAPGRAHFELMAQVNGLYRACQLAGMPPAAVRPKIERLLGSLQQVRAGLGPTEQRDLDLGMLRWIRRASALSVVIGAGVTMDAGGPSWPALVRQLLVRALDRGHEISEMRPDPGNTRDEATFRRHVVDVERFDAAQEAEARGILAAIDAGTADTEALMRGAQLCGDLMGQHLFTDLTDVLYDGGKRQPGAIHRAIAELAREQLVPDRPPHRFPGWEAIISYNFDDLQGEAIDALGLPRATWAMRGERMAGDPNATARAAGQDSVYQPIYHLHGYTPRRLFNITHVRFVFSTSQYLAFYADDPTHVITHVLHEHLAHPIKYALYVGCSFTDERMNDLLRQAADVLPGRWHYALLRWPGGQTYARAGASDLEAAAAAYLRFGVQPIWFERFDEIPETIRALA